MADKSSAQAAENVEACPMGLVVKVEDKPASKCIACGICAKRCPMGILEVVEN